MTVSIYGASDDLVEVEGDVREEFSYGDGPGYVALSSGVLLSIEYTRAGIWRIAPVSVPDGVVVAVKQAVSADDDVYSDTATVEGDIAWVAYATEYATRKPVRA